MCAPRSAAAAATATRERYWPQPPPRPRSSLVSADGATGAPRSSGRPKELHRRRRSSHVRAVAAVGAPASAWRPPRELPGWLLLTQELHWRRRSSCVGKLTNEGAPSIMELLRRNTCMHAAGPCMGKSQACRRTIMRNFFPAVIPGASVIFLAQQSPTLYYHTMSQKYD